jgi:hypothetical protein
MQNVFSVTVSPEENDFLSAYFHCMIWADSPEGANLFLEDLHPEFNRQHTIEALGFFLKYEHAIGSENISQAGHDLWLTRQGHGTGFWDRGDAYNDLDSGYDFADMLTQGAKTLGHSDIEFIESSLIREGVNIDS